MEVGKASREGTQRYKKKMEPHIPPEHFHQANGWWISSIGIGTYLGEADEEADMAYEDSVKRALVIGCNLIDTAINYRHQRSERSVGAALQEAFGTGKISRDEIVIATKGGFLTFDGEVPEDPSGYFFEEYLKPGVLRPEDLIAGCHCIAPSYLENQLERSLKNLNLESIDIYFVHNPETQLSKVPRKEFLKRMLAAFRMLEEKVVEGKIQVYGTATWDGYRVDAQSREHLSLEELQGLAREAGGKSHHFRAIQLPFNLGMPEALVKKNQSVGLKNVSLLEAAESYGMLVLSSASILQGRLAKNLPDFLFEYFEGFETCAQRSIQFVRSTRGISAALIGMRRVEHVEENLRVAKQAPVAWDKMQELFTRVRTED